MLHFCCEKTAFSKFSGLYLDFNITFEKNFGLRLNLDRVFRKLDWIWIAQYDSPLISAVLIRTREAGNADQKVRQ